MASPADFNHCDICKKRVISNIDRCVIHSKIPCVKCKTIFRMKFKLQEKCPKCRTHKPE